MQSHPHNHDNPSSEPVRLARRGAGYAQLVWKLTRTAALACMVYLFAAATGFAVAPASLEGGGRLSGLVTDPSGGAMAGATVQALNTDTGLDHSTVTNAEGLYAFPALPAGRYELRIDQPGFKPYRQRNLEVAANTASRADVVLVLGPRSEAITIEESPVAVDTANTQMGELIGGTKLESVPLNGRSYTDLLALQPGVIPVTSQQPNAVVMSGCTNAPPSGDQNPGNIAVSGQRETANGFFVNGSSAQEDFNMGAAIVPNLESIQEFQVLTGNFDAQYGNFSGGQVLVTTKGGANELHGSGFEFLRNTSLDARSFFASERARFDRNQFGGTLGGPVHKDRTFFFIDYQGTRMTQGLETGRISVPSLANRTGDLSDVAGSLTGTVNGQYWANLLTQKLGYGVLAGEPYYTSGCTNSEQCVLPNARIPQHAWSAPAASLLAYIPTPNQGANTFSTSAENQTLRDDKGAVRLDSTTRWGVLSAYYHVGDYRLDNPYPTGQGGANVPGFNALSFGRAQMATLGLTTTLSPSSVNELRIGYTRAANDIGQPVGGVGPSLVSQGFHDAAGTPGIVALAPKIEGVENVSFNDFTIGVDTTGVVQANNTYQWSEALSKVIGRHMLKLGAGMHFDQVNINPNATYNGAFLFQGTETGSDYADFLLGIASSYAQGDSNAFYLRNKYAGLYVQDSWQVRPNVTFNYGVRWDLLPPWREKYNQLQTAVLGQQSVVYPGAPTGMVFPGDPGIPSTLSPSQYKNFAPRLGLAYAPGFADGWLGKLFGGPGKTSIRAGYGIFYTAIEGLSAGIMSACPPYGYDYDSFAPPLFETPFVTAASGQNVGQRFPEPIPASGASAQHPNGSIDWSQYMPITGMPSFYYRNATPYTESYSFSVERDLGRHTLLNLGYVGSQAHRLLVLISANPGNPALCKSLSDPANVMAGTATCGPFGESGTYVTNAGKTIQGTRGPFDSNFAAVTYQKTIGNSNYNSFEASVRHSTGPVEFLLGYTYGKSIDQSSSLSEAVNPLNQSLSRAVSAFDMRHNFVASYDWKLPLGALFQARNRWTEGWSLSGITRFSTGLPVTLYNNNDTSLLGTIPNGINNNGVDTPNYTQGNLAVDTDPRNGRAAFNTALFSLPELGTLGTAGRRFFYGPGIVNYDMALHKRVPFGESRAMELRLEAFNVFNHAQFYGAAAVNGNITSGSFGQITSSAAPRLIQVATKFSF
ncbi:MAG: carboxypeptidase regulatory-like domain-containing protein [Bryobacteraceae bacterium]|nr:carboxypeptidase regulatory-like domain-containing protein [Bryobacteraceae bacterium]